MATHHVKITGQDGQRGSVKEILAQTVQGKPDIKAYADQMLRNFEGGKSHYEHVVCTISEQNPDTRLWKVIHIRAAGGEWAVPRTIGAEAQTADTSTPVSDALGKRVQPITIIKSKDRSTS